MSNQIKNAELTSRYVEQFYDQFLSSSGHSYRWYRWASNPVAQYHYQQTKRLLGMAFSLVKGDVLEIGGGDGLWTEQYLDRVESLVFLDISTEMLKQAQKNLTGNNKIRFLHQDFLTNDLSAHSFDTIVSIRNFEYFNDKEKAVSELKRLLRPGGRIIMITKNPVADWRRYFAGKTLHSGQVSLAVLKLLAKKHELVIEKILPAIIGKKINWLPFRWLFGLIHRLTVGWNTNILPLTFSQFLSESFLIIIRKP